jgi:hypothetical protein
MIRDEEFEGAERVMSEYKGMVISYEKTGRDINSLDEYYRAAITEEKNSLKKLHDLERHFVEGLKKEIIGEGLVKILEMTRQKTTASGTQMSKPPLEGIDDLISRGSLANDGRKVLDDLNSVAAYLADKQVKVTNKLIKLYFRKFDDTEYSDSAITQAVNYANTQQTYIKPTKNSY